MPQVHRPNLIRSQQERDRFTSRQLCIRCRAVRASISPRVPGKVSLKVFSAIGGQDRNSNHAPARRGAASDSYGRRRWMSKARAALATTGLSRRGPSALWLSPESQRTSLVLRGPISSSGLPGFDELRRLIAVHVQAVQNLLVSHFRELRRPAETPEVIV